jgi:protein ImuA
VENRNIRLEELRRCIAGMEETRRRQRHTTVTSTCEELDNLLPDGGFRRGTLVEWISSGDGTGACTFAMLAAREACRNGGVLAILDRHGEFFPPAAVRLGVALEQLMVVRTEHTADHDWAMDQVLRSPAVAATLAWPERLDSRTFRRWQLAVEEGGGLGLLIRPAAARSEPSWADVRLWIEPQPRVAPIAPLSGSRKRQEVQTQPLVPCGTPIASNRAHPTVFIQTQKLIAPESVALSMATRTRHLRVALLRCRGGVDGRSVEVELNDETYRVHPIARRRLQLAT